MDDAFEKYGVVNSNYIIFSEKNMYLSSINPNDCIKIQHDIDKNKINDFNKIFIEQFPKKTLGFMTNNDAIKLYFTEQKTIKKDKEKKVFYVDFNFSKKPVNYKKFVQILLKMPSSIGYVDSYPYTEDIYYNKIFDVEFNINYDKIDKFKEFIKNIKNSIKNL